MKVWLYLTGLILLFSCTQKQVSTDELKLKFGDFGQETIRTIPVDVTQTPIYKSIQKHPENFAYLDRVDIWSMAHLSGGNFVTGFMVTPKKPGKYPCIVFNRTGNQEMGRLIVATAVEIMAPIAAAGYVVVASNYRGNSGSEGREEFGGSDVQDVLNLIKSLTEVEMADTSRIGLFGISRGGMMNYIALKQDTYHTVKAAVTIGGITDLEKTMAFHPPIEKVAQELIPDFEYRRQTAIISRSANYWVDSLSRMVPLLIMHSRIDEHVTYSQVADFADSLDKYNVPYQFISFANDNHGLMDHREMVMKKTIDWFDKYVKQGLAFDETEQRMDIN